MTIEERLNAITQTLELTARMQQDFKLKTEERLAQLQAQFEREQSAAAERLKRIEDNLIVQGEVVARVDRQLGEFALRTAKWIERTDAWIESAETRLAELQVLVRTAH